MSARSDDGQAHRVAVLRFTPSPPAAGIGFPADHEYLDLVYMPLVGASAVALLRRVDRALAGCGNGIDLDAATLALELGLRSRSADALGQRSPLMRTLSRLSRQQLIKWLGAGHIGVYRPVPPLRDASVARITEAAYAAHWRFTEAGET